MDLRLLDLAIILASLIPNVALNRLLDLIAETEPDSNQIWTAFVVVAKDEPSRVLGGCLMREFFNKDFKSDGTTALPERRESETSRTGFVELHLMAIAQDCQAFGLGRKLLHAVKDKYS